MRPLLAGLVPLFERAHGVTLDVEFRLTAALKQAIEAGATFDLAILPRPELDGLIARGDIAPGSAADLARSTVGLAVRTGALKPDIGSVGALRHALLQAQSLAYSDGPSGVYVADLLAKLGIAEEVASKTTLTSGPVAELIARRHAADRRHPAGQRRRIGRSAASGAAKRHCLCRRGFNPGTPSRGRRGLYRLGPEQNGATADARLRAGAGVVRASATFPTDRAPAFSRSLDHRLERRKCLRHRGFMAISA
jgi:hypothetical protein